MSFLTRFVFALQVKDFKRAYILTDQGLSTTNKSLKSILVNMNLEN